MTFPTDTLPSVALAGPAPVGPPREAIAPLAMPAPVPPPLAASLAALAPAPVAPPAVAAPARRHDVTVVKRIRAGIARVMAVPPEEFGISRRARTLAEADYCFHAVQKPEHQLIAEGFDAEQVKALPSEGADEDAEAAARSSVDEGGATSDSLNRSARMIEITEHYIRLDLEGDGRARLYRIVTGGGSDGEILRRRVQVGSLLHLSHRERSTALSESEARAGEGLQPREPGSIAPSPGDPGPRPGRRPLPNGERWARSKRGARATTTTTTAKPSRTTSRRSTSCRSRR